MNKERITLVLEALDAAAEAETHDLGGRPDPELYLDAISVIEQLSAQVNDLEARNANLHNELSRARAMEASY